MSWLPHITVQGTCIADTAWEAEGWLVHIRIGRLVIEFTVAWIDRTYGETPDAR